MMHILSPSKQLLKNIPMLNYNEMLSFINKKKITAIQNNIFVQRSVQVLLKIKIWAFLFESVR